MNIFKLCSVRIRLCLSLLIVLLVIATLSKPIIVSSAGPSYKYSDSTLYEMYFNWKRKGNSFNALLYLFAYQMREPPAYLNNAVHNSEVNSEIKRLKGVINDALILQTNVNIDLNYCGCYPCGDCQNTSRSTYTFPTPLPPKIVPPPPDSVIVCVDINYQGQCRVLPIGVYNNDVQIGLPNDTISSVMVGSQVKLTLYVHGGLTGEWIPFTSNDSDLTNNSIDSTYMWNDNTTSLKVEWR